MELSIGLRNKVEHRYHEAINESGTGYAQALLLNYEKELTATFGADFSLGEPLRFPIFIGAITALGQAKLKHPAMRRPKARATLSRALSRTSIKRSLMTVVMSSALI